ncbi:MAG: transporter substrate-binding domain-containing protein [Myxococcota bacterium]|nr:transporter substrate-binding domain-containing protein [Myxococcota bacterium]
MVRSLIGLLVTLAFLVGVPAGALAASPVLERVVKTGKLRVGMSGDQAPLNMKNKAGKVIGMEADLAVLLAGSMNVELEIVTKPFPELLDAVQKGEVDMVMSGMTITPERNLKVAFVGPYFVSGKSVLTKSQKLASITEATPINDPSVSLAALGNSTSEKFVQTVTPKAKLVKVAEYEAGVKKVLDDEVDGLVADYPICVLSVLRYPDRGLATLVTPLTIEPIGIALPAEDSLLLNLVTNYLSALQATGVLEALRSRWFDDGSWLAELP